MIKILRVTNYDVVTGICEFIDNALDAGATRIEVNLKERVQGSLRRPHRIVVSDNVPGGIPSDILPKIFSLTYDRRRVSDDIGEYGLGFKAASFNLGEKMVVYTKTNHVVYQVNVDWLDMSDTDRWDPEMMSISNEIYERNHPFETGTSFVLENLRPEFFSTTPITNHPNNEGDTSTGTDPLSEWYEQLAYIYRYLLLEKPDVSITLRGLWPGGNQESRDLRHHGVFSWASDPCPVVHPDNTTTPTTSTTWIYSWIRVYQDEMDRLRAFTVTTPLKKDRPLLSPLDDPSSVITGERVECTKKWKNGNRNFRTVSVDPPQMERMVLVDTLLFRSVHESEAFRSSELMQRHATCRLDMRRRNRVVARDINLRHPDSQKMQYFVKHEVEYKNYALNMSLGVQFNKKNAGGIPEGELRNVLEYLQNRHEKICEDQEKSLYLQKMMVSASAFVSSLPPPPPPALELPSLPFVITTNPKRRNFSEKTKIHVLQRQECRDRLLDVILDNHILPMEYDHADGTPTNNSSDNCQALSVITHAIKTRSPEVYEKLEQDTTTDRQERKEFLVRLLNSILSSKYLVVDQLVYDPTEKRFHHSTTTSKK